MNVNFKNKQIAQMHMYLNQGPTEGQLVLKKELDRAAWSEKFEFGCDGKTGQRLIKGKKFSGSNSGYLKKNNLGWKDDIYHKESHADLRLGVEVNGSWAKPNTSQSFFDEDRVMQ
jgi:hypothetical protein